MPIFQALIMFINAEETETPECMKITFMLYGDFEETDLCIGFAPTEIFNGIQHGQSAYISGRTTDTGYILISEIISYKGGQKYEQ